MGYGDDPILIDMSGDTQWQLLDRAVVLVAQVHNPSLINDDFLRHKKIVPHRWQLSPESLLITPVLARIQYQNFLLEISPQRFLVNTREDNSHPQDPGAIYQCARQYVKTLPHIPYKAIGLNGTVKMTPADPINWFRQNFLTDKKWHNNDAIPSSLALKIPTDNGICTMTATVDNQHVFVRSNFHFDVSQPEQLLAILHDWKKYDDCLHSHLAQYFGGGKP